MGCSDSKSVVEPSSKTAVQKTIKDNLGNSQPVDVEITDEDRENFKKDMQELFSRMDKDSSGSLDKPEVILFMKALSDDLSDEHISMIFDNLDEDSSNTIDLDEFMTLFNQISVAGWRPVDKGGQEQVNEEEVRQLFNLIDTDKTGVITAQEAIKAGELIRERFCIEEIDQWMKDTDLNKDGVVSYDEFKESLRKSISNFF